MACLPRCLQLERASRRQICRRCEGPWPCIRCHMHPYRSSPPPRSSGPCPAKGFTFNPCLQWRSRMRDSIDLSFDKRRLLDSETHVMARHCVRKNSTSFITVISKFCANKRYQLMASEGMKIFTDVQNQIGSGEKSLVNSVLKDWYGKLPATRRSQRPTTSERARRMNEWECS